MLEADGRELASLLELNRDATGDAAMLGRGESRENAERQVDAGLSLLRSSRPWPRRRASTSPASTRLDVKIELRGDEHSGLAPSHHVHPEAR